MCHHAWILAAFLYQESITKMEQPTKSSDCNDTKHTQDKIV